MSTGVVAATEVRGVSSLSMSSLFVSSMSVCSETSAATDGAAYSGPRTGLQRMAKPHYRSLIVYRNIPLKEYIEKNWYNINTNSSVYALKLIGALRVRMFLDDFCIFDKRNNC